MYDFKSILLEGYDADNLEEKHCNLLNEYFTSGWEYVDNISQCIAQSSNGTKYGSIIVILRKKKEEITL